jgi:hypothetical protein
MKSPRLSRTTTGNLTHLTSNQTVDQLTSDVLLPTQDGGNSSDIKVLKLSTRKVRLLKFKVNLITKTETLLLEIEITKSTNNGILSMLMNGRENQPKVNSTRDSGFMLKEISTLSQLLKIKDTSISSTTEIWSSRLEMEEELKSGTSTNNH